MFADPPAYVASQGQFPLLKGVVEVTGEMQMEGDVELRDEKQMGPDVRPKSRQTWSENKSPYLDCYKQVQTALEELKTQYEQKPQSRKKSLEQTKRVEEEIDVEARLFEEELNRRIKETEKFVQETDKVLKSSESLGSKGEEGVKESAVDEGRWSRDDEQGRLRPLTKQLPILIKGAQGQYIPWASQDLEGLVTRLPDMHEGAGKWIRVFEEETMGKLLAVGDIKALLAKIIGGAKMEEILQASGLERAVNSHYIDGTVYDVFRPAVWQALRAEYPTRVDPKALKGEQLGETENPVTYVQRQLKRWKQETEGNPEGDPLMATLFRNAIIEAMPQTVKSKLEDVVGLNSKTHKEFCDHVSHAVELYRKNEQKLLNQEKELQRKLTQLQLEELTAKRKKKVQAVVTKEESNQMTVMPPVNASHPAVQPTLPAATPPNANQVPSPIVNVYAQQQRPSEWGRKPRPQGQRGGGRMINYPPGVCCGCGQPGHYRRNCPTNPWPQAPGAGRGAGWQPPFPGPVNHWGSQNHEC
ncbi:Gag polyprotein [Labeo rohita]|uniref:Gag polyprotein n=1 Tax=Labeo rohita TaxID=84645 RepID=A0ABQ8MF36_LABRO|nr:Gag polyprotein [Labeo rohita]